MILETVPAPPSTHQNTHPAINRTSRHYAGAMPNPHLVESPHPERVNNLLRNLELVETAAVANGPEIFSNPENHDEKLQHYAVQRQGYEEEKGCHDDQHKDASYLVQ
jgi:hypothetical protein